MNFPKLNINQIAVLYSEITTGIVLNNDLKYNLDDSKFEYLIFSSLDEAKKYCDQKVKEFPGIECNLYNSTYKHILRIDVKKTEWFK